MSARPADRNPGSFLRTLAMAGELPFLLVGSVVIGGGLGYLLDRWLHTAPWLMLALGLLGFLSGIWNLLRRLSRDEKEEEDGAG